MIYGLTDVEFKFLQEKLIQPLKDKKAQVFLFGSRATGKHQKYSDIDLLFVPAVDGAIPSHFIHSLLSEIEDSHFSYKIDLVDQNELASSYRANVEKEKIQL